MSMILSLLSFHIKHGLYVYPTHHTSPLIPLISLHKVQHTRLPRGRNINALPEGRNQRTKETLFLLLVVLRSKQGLDGPGGLLGLVEGDAAEEVVHDVIINNLVEEMAADETHCAVDGSESALGVGPRFRGVVRDGGVGVLEVCDGDCLC
jgi:hypothetical protein